MEINNRAAQPTLLFVPDISGFTQFVNQTEIAHSQHIIEELLEILIDANEINLEVSEIEGDAILFYRNGSPPTAAELLAQVQRMYVRFHAHLKLYETHRICQCGACCGATNLTLKFVVHYGETGINKIKNHSKLFGRDVIVAHRLLKNEVQDNEYALFTNDLVNACSTWVEVKQVAWSEPEHRSEAYDLGEIAYCFVSLKPLEAHVPEPRIEDYSLKGEVKKVLGHERILEAPIDLAFDVLSDLSIRHEWIEGIRDSDMLNSKITRNGSTHRCVIKRDESDPFMVTHNFQTGKDYIAFTDTNHKKGIDTVFTLRRIGPSVTRLEVYYFMKRNVVFELIIKLFMQKKMKTVLENSCDRLNQLCKELVAEGRQHPAKIILHPAMEMAA